MINSAPDTIVTSEDLIYDNRDLFSKSYSMSPLNPANPSHPLNPANPANPIKHIGKDKSYEILCSTGSKTVAFDYKIHIGTPFSDFIQVFNIPNKKMVNLICNFAEMRLVNNRIDEHIIEKYLYKKVSDGNYKKIE